MELLKRSTRLRDFERYFREQTKHPNLTFISHDNVLLFNEHPEFVRGMFYLYKSECDFWLTLKQVGRRSAIIDGDTLLNKKWARIWR